LHSLLHSCFCLDLPSRSRTEPRIQRKTKRQIWRHNRISAVLCCREEMGMLPRCETARHATFVMLLGDEHHPLLFNKVGTEREMNLDTCFPPAMYSLTERTECFLNFNPICHVSSKVACENLYILNISLKLYKSNKTKGNGIKCTFFLPTTRTDT
jgi:hypothetical protein